MKNKVLVVILIMSIALIVTSYPIWCEAKELQTIVVAIGDCICGNHMASFETVYNRKKIEVSLYYDGSTTFIKDNKETPSWHNLFCPKPGSDNGPLSGKTVRIKGKWESPNSFHATAIYY